MIDLSPVSTVVPSHCDYGLVKTYEELDDLIKQMWECEIIGLDTETEGIGYTDVIVGICISVREGHGRYIAIRHEQEAMDGYGERYDNQLDPDKVFARLRPVLIKKVFTGHNTKFDLKMFWKDGCDVNFVHDTLILSTLLANDPVGTRGLKDMVFKRFGHKMTELDSFFTPARKSSKPVIRPKLLKPEDIMRYGCEDADYSLRLQKVLWDEALSTYRTGEQRKSFSLLYKMEMKLSRVVADMEEYGVPASSDFLNSREEEAAKYLSQLKARINQEVKLLVPDLEEEINFNSPKRLQELLYDELKLPSFINEKTGKRTTAGYAMEELAKEHPIVARILTYRLLHKLHSSFLKKFPTLIHTDGRIRASFHQSGTESGRFSSSSPNLQQIPKAQTFHLWSLDDEEACERLAREFSNILRYEPTLRVWQSLNTEVNVWGNFYLGKSSDGNEYAVHQGEIWQAWKCPTRQFMSADENHYIVEADYSQIELRVMAGESREPTLLEAYRSGDDVHKKTASLIFDIPFDKVTKEQRSVGKTINFGLLYGAGPKKISEELNTSMKDAKEIIDRYFKNLPAILSWINVIKAHSSEDEYAMTRLGRIRRFPEINSDDKGTSERQKREAVNHHIQGGAADILKLALCRLHSRLWKYFGNRVRLICTVHDSVILECHKSVDPQDLASVLNESMKYRSGKDGWPDWGWPDLEVDIEFGADWAHTSPLKVSAQNLPRLENDSTAPPLRASFLARERDGLSLALPESPSTSQEPIKKVVSTTEESVPSFTQSSNNVSSSDTSGEANVLGQWVLQVERPMSVNVVNKLQEFLAKRTSVGRAYSFQLVNAGKSVSVPGVFQISKDDELYLKTFLGPCRLLQDKENFNVLDILK